MSFFYKNKSDMSMHGEMFNSINRPMISNGIDHIKKVIPQMKFFPLVYIYAKENIVLLNGGYLANNLTDGENHITTAPIYRLWKYLPLMELVGIVDFDSSSAKKIKILGCGGISSYAKDGMNALYLKMRLKPQ